MSVDNLVEPESRFRHMVSEMGRHIAKADWDLALELIDGTPEKERNSLYEHALMLEAMKRMGFEGGISLRMEETEATREAKRRIPQMHPLKVYGRSIGYREF